MLATVAFRLSRSGARMLCIGQHTSHTSGNSPATSHMEVKRLLLNRFSRQSSVFRGSVPTLLRRDGVIQQCQMIRCIAG